MENKKSCFFTGHRNFPLANDPDFIDHFKYVLFGCVDDGVVYHDQKHIKSGTFYIPLFISY